MCALLSLLLLLLLLLLLGRSFGRSIGLMFFFSWGFDSYGGPDASLATKAKGEVRKIGADGQAIAGDAKEGALKVVDQTKEKAGQLKDKVVK